MREVIVHEDYNRTGDSHANDIALLRLSKDFKCSIILLKFPGERVDLFDFPPVCLPSQEQDISLIGKTASVYGESSVTVLCILLSLFDI